MIRYVVTYDIADDGRREDVATLLSGYGPRVQLSVFECDLQTRREAAALRAELRELIDPVEDQVRLYPLDASAARQVAVIGAGHRGAPGLLDRHVSRTVPMLPRPIPVRLAREKALVSGLRSRIRPDHAARPVCSLRGWRTGPQSARSRGSPRRIRYKAQPDTEGIETH